LRDPRSWSRVTIGKRELSALSREKTIVLAILIQLFIAAFSSFLVVGLTSLYDPGAVEEGEIEVGVTGEQQNRLVEAAQTEGVGTVRFQSQSDATTAFEDGDVDAVLVATSEQAEQGRVIQVDAIVPSEDLRTTLIVVQVRSVLTELERTERLARSEFLEQPPVAVPSSTDGSPFFGFTYTILLPLLLFLPAFISGSIVVDSITEEIERGTLELLRAAPLSLTDIVDGKAGAMILLAPLQAVLWIGLLRLNGIGISHVLPLLVVVTAIATITVVLGIVLALVTARRRQAQLLYSILALLLFGTAALLPEHPASTIALLAVDSTTPGTFAHVAGITVFAVVVLAVVRRYVTGLDPESL
jgi:ABC-type Na+ efflux pump permease subunit